MPHKAKLKYRDLQKLHKGRIIILNYATCNEGRRTLVFSPVEDVVSHMRCNCGHAVWNATNFGNLVHFCPDREVEVEVTDYTATLTK